MPTGRLLKLDAYIGVLPYSSELFGVYQPMIGWRASRAKRWLAARAETVPLLDRLTDCFGSAALVKVSEKDCSVHAENLRPASFARPKLAEQKSVLLVRLAEVLAKLGHETEPPGKDVWQNLAGSVDKVLQTSVLRTFNEQSMEYCSSTETYLMARHEGSNERLRREHSLRIERSLAYETQVGGVVVQLAEAERYDMLEQIFYSSPRVLGSLKFKTLLAYLGFQDPLDNFDPINGDLTGVTVSPIGVTHLFRQYFFELDTFLGTPVAHLYVPPGSTSEIMEVSTRRRYVEKTIEQSSETIRKEETSTTDQDEISEAIKQENKQDMKLGVSSTVNQS